MEEKLAILGRELEFEQLEKQKLRDDLALHKHRETEQQEQIKALRRETKALKGANEGHSIIASERATLKVPFLLGSLRTTFKRASVSDSKKRCLD